MCPLRQPIGCLVKDINQFFSRLQFRLAFGIALIAFLAMLAAGSIFYMQVRAYQVGRWQSLLSDMAVTKTDTLQRWQSDQRRVVEMFALVPTIRDEADALMTLDSGSLAWQEAHDVLALLMDMIASHEPYIDEMLLLGPADGRVWVSSVPQHEGLYRAGDAFFVYGRRGTYVSGLYPWPVSRQTMATISTPVLSPDGRLVGVLAVHLNLSYLQRLLNDASILESGGRLMLIDEYHHVVASGVDVTDDAAALHSPAVQHVLMHGSGLGKYVNDDGQKVLGVYRWLDTFQAGLIIEIPYSEVLAQAHSLARKVLLSSVLLFFALGIGGFALTRFVVRPLEALTATIQKVRAGDMTARADIVSNDELGLLAKQFNHMLDELAQAYESLRVQQISYEMLFEEAPDGIVLLSARHTIEIANQGFMELLQASDDDLVFGEHIENFVDISTEAWQVLDAQGVLRLRDAMKQLDGGALPVDIRCKRLPDERIQMIFTDISDQFRAEQLMQNMQASLEKMVAQRTSELQMANQELEAFTYSVSHDLRAPLRAISGFLRMFIDRYGEGIPEDGRVLLQKVNDNSRRLSELIQHLLVISRLGRRALKIRPLSADDLRQILLEIIDDLEMQHPDYERVQVTLNDLLPCEADPTLLRQVFENLLSNAFKFSVKQDAPQVEVFSFQGMDGPAYAVRDNGVGFNMDYADKVFMLFQRLHTDTDFEGHGVGLTIVRRIVMRHGGRIWAESKPGQGTTFYFTLPKAETA